MKIIIPQDQDLPPADKIPESYWQRIVVPARNLAARTRYTHYELHANVANRISEAKRVRDRGETFFGRILNRMTTAVTEGVILDGQVVKQLFELAEEKPPIEILWQYQYLFEIEEAVALLSKARSAMSE